MNLASDVAALLMDRQKHVDAIKQIDEEMDRARMALGLKPAIVGPLTSGHQWAPPKTRTSSLQLQEKLIDALSHGPLSVSQMEAAGVGIKVSVGACAQRLWTTGRIFRRKPATGDFITRKTYLYALSEAALDAFFGATQAEQEEALALEAKAG